MISLDTVRWRPAARESQPERLAEHAREAELLQAELAKLGPIERAAIVMHYWYDLSYQEISTALGLSVSAVKSRMLRARRDLAARSVAELRTGGREPGSVTTA